MCCSTTIVSHEHQVIAPFTFIPASCAGCAPAQCVPSLHNGQLRYARLRSVSERCFQVYRSPKTQCRVSDRPGTRAHAPLASPVETAPAILVCNPMLTPDRRVPSRQTRFPAHSEFVPHWIRPM